MQPRRAVRVLAAAFLLSATGGRIAGVALAYVVYDRTGSAIWLAVTFLFNFGITGFLTPFAGHIADRFDRRRVMIVSNAASAACWVVFVFVREPVALVALGFVASVIAMPYWFAVDAAIPNMVRDEDLAWANGTMGAARSISMIAGPAAGGALYAATGGPGIPFAVNAVSFVVSAALVAAVRGVRFSESAQGSQPADEHHGAFRGFAVLWGDAFLRSLFIAWTLSYLGMNIAFVADPPLARSFGVGAVGYGSIDASFGIGALLGALLARRISQEDERRWVIVGLAGVAVGWFMIAGAPFFALVLFASALAAGTHAFGTVAAYSIVQRRSADAVRGRVFAALNMAGLLANAVGFVLVGPLVEWLGAQFAYAMGGVVMVFATAAFWIPTAPGRAPLLVETTDPPPAVMT